MRHLGIAAGFGIQVLAVCAALGMLLACMPHLGSALQWIGAGCAVYLGWRLLRSRDVRAACGGAPLTFSEVAAVQFLNPRAWLTSLAAATLFLPPELEQVLTGAFPGRI